jgi:hypothetical protein
MGSGKTDGQVFSTDKITTAEVDAKYLEMFGKDKSGKNIDPDKVGKTYERADIAIDKMLEVYKEVFKDHGVKEPELTKLVKDAEAALQDLTYDVARNNYSAFIELDKKNQAEATKNGTHYDPIVKDHNVKFEDAVPRTEWNEKLENGTINEVNTELLNVEEGAKGLGVTGFGGRTKMGVDGTTLAKDNDNVNGLKISSQSKTSINMVEFLEAKGLGVVKNPPEKIVEPKEISLGLLEPHTNKPTIHLNETSGALEEQVKSTGVVLSTLKELSKNGELNNIEAKEIHLVHPSKLPNRTGSVDLSTDGVTSDGVNGRNTGQMFIDTTKLEKLNHVSELTNTILSGGGDKRQPAINELKKEGLWPEPSEADKDAAMQKILGEGKAKHINNPDPEKNHVLRDDIKYEAEMMVARRVEAEYVKKEIVPPLEKASLERMIKVEHLDPKSLDNGHDINEARNLKHIRDQIDNNPDLNKNQKEQLHKGIEILVRNNEPVNAKFAEKLEDLAAGRTTIESIKSEKSAETAMSEDLKKFGNFSIKDMEELKNLGAKFKEQIENITRDGNISETEYKQMQEMKPKEGQSR